MDGMIKLQSTGFLRGSTRFPDEQPVRNVRLSPYWIDRFPVTNEDYSKFIQAGGYARPEFWTQSGWSFVCRHQLHAPLYWQDENWNKSRQPVTGISWWEAMAYAAFMAKTL